MTAVPLPARLAEIEAALAKATPGPWRVPYPFTKLIDGPQTQLASAESAADAALIVAAVNALPWLLATVREQADVIDKARALADESPEPGHSTLWLQGRMTVIDRLRAVLPADHGQDTGEGR